MEAIILINIHHLHNLIDDNIFSDKQETTYKCNFSQHELNVFDELFDNLFTSEIVKILNLQSMYSPSFKYVIKPSVVEEYIKQLYLLNCPKILKSNLTNQQFFLLYITCISFYRYNDRILKLKNHEFIHQIYFPNILAMCSKYFIQARRILFKLIKNIYIEFKDDLDSNFSYILYKENENNIKNNILQIFLTNVLPKFNPFDLENLEDFYTILFKRIFFFYLKTKTINDDILLLNSNTQDDILENQSERFRIYEDAIYLSQIQQICSESTELNTINLEFDKFKKIILPNEIQKLFLYKTPSSKSNKIASRLNLFTICSTNSPLLNKIKNKLPNIYKLLRSIHIMTPNSLFSEADKMYMREQFYTTLILIFKDKFDINSISHILKNISDNLTDSLTSGEFIDMISLTQVEINGFRFIDQFKDFLKIILTDTLDFDNCEN